MSEQWPAGYDFLFPHFLSGFIVSTADTVSDGAVVPVDSRLEAILVQSTGACAGLGGVGNNFKVKVNEASSDGPSFNWPEGAVANKGHLLRPTDFVDYTLLAGDYLQVESDGLQIGVTVAFILFILRPI